MIMSKEKPYKYNNISVNNTTKNKRNVKKKIDKQKRNNTSLLIDSKGRMNYSSLSQENLHRVKNMKRFFLYSSRNDSKNAHLIKSKKKHGFIKTQANNQSCRQLNNKLKLYEKIYKKRDSNKFVDTKKLLSILSQYKKNAIGKKNERTKNEETDDSLVNSNGIYTYNNSKTKFKKYLNRSSDSFNLKNLEYMDSETNFKNKQLKDDYDKDLEYHRLNSPYKIKVKLTNKLKDDTRFKNSSSNYLITNNDSTFSLNKSKPKIEKNNNINLDLIKEKVNNFIIKKSYFKSMYVNSKKKYAFDNDDEIINFVKNKFKEKNCKYLAELQSKNYITNIFGNNNKSKKKKQNLYSGLILTKKYKGKIMYEVELNNINDLNSINKLLKEEKLEMNNEPMLFTTGSYLLQLKKEKKNIKNEFNKLKEDYKNICYNSSKLKDENNFGKLKFVKLKHDYDNILKEYNIALSRNKELINEINQKDSIIKKYDKIINQNKNEIKNINDNVYIIQKEIEFKLLKKIKNKKNKITSNSANNANSVPLKSKQKNIKIKKICNFCFERIKKIKRKIKIKIKKIVKLNVIIKIIGFMEILLKFKKSLFLTIFLINVIKIKILIHL